jgi:leader peptidase (prepilin peptidase)/N-methyltransferase
VPLVSWLVLRGRCRSCGAAISWVYPGVELTTALLIAGCVWKFGLSWEAAVASAFCAALVAVSAIDLKHRIIPNRIVVPGAVAILAAQTAIHPSPEWAISAFGAFAFLLVAALVYRAGMGMGDVKLALMLGAMLGRTVVPGMFIGFVAALVPSAILFARHGSAARKMGLPFAPFLALGAVIALFAGHEILHAYLSLSGK